MCVFTRYSRWSITNYFSFALYCGGWLAQLVMTELYHSTTKNSEAEKLPENWSAFSERHCFKSSVWIAALVGSRERLTLTSKTSSVYMLGRGKEHLTGELLLLEAERRVCYLNALSDYASTDLLDKTGADWQYCMLIGESNSLLYADRCFKALSETKPLPNKRMKLSGSRWIGRE